MWSGSATCAMVSILVERTAAPQGCRREAIQASGSTTDDRLTGVDDRLVEGLVDCCPIDIAAAGEAFEATLVGLRQLGEVGSDLLLDVGRQLVGNHQRAVRDQWR